MTVPAPAGLSPRPLVPPPIRGEPSTPDPFDSERIAYAWQHWDMQTAALLMRDRTIEESVWMLCGKQDIAWSRSQQQFVDLDEVFRDQQDLRWRHRPRLNRLAGWYAQTVARMTENPPILTFLPGPDAIDAELAETMDTLFKSQWRELGMLAVHEQMIAWLAVGGRAYIESMLEATQGEAQAWRGQADVPVVGPDGQPIMGPNGPATVPYPDAAFGPNGETLTVMQQSEQGMQPVDLAEPHSAPTGRLIPTALSPLEVRGEWGPTPWHEKKWHAKRSFLPPSEAWKRWKVHVEATTTGMPTGLSGNGALERMLFGGGFFGAASHIAGANSGSPQQSSDAFAEIITFWEAPRDDVPGYEKTEASPGGRLLVCTRTKVLWDSARPLDYKYTSPIRAFDFFKLPGRPNGTSPMEFLCPIQRAYNRTWGSITEHAARMTNPFWVIDKGSGLDQTQITNEVGQKFTVNRNGNVPAIELVAPPALGDDVYKCLGLLLEEFNAIGELQGTQSGDLSKDASGELVKELRFNSDRYLGPTMRAMVEEYGRLAEDWMTIFPVLWPVEKIVRYAGEDYVARTLSVLPLMFEQGTVNIQPDVESMLPEGRGERQQKALEMYQMGLFGMAGTPQAISAYLDLAKFPNFSRLHRPGGPNRITAEHLLGRLLQGDLTVVQPDPQSGYPQLWWPWYDPSVHLMVLQDFMNKPEFLKLDPQTKQLLASRWSFVSQLAQQQQMQQQAAMMAQQQAQTGGDPAPQGGPQ